MTKTTDTTKKPKSKHIRLKTACDEYGFAYSTVRDAHFRGELSVIKIGSNDHHAAWYIERKELERWIESRRVSLA